MRKLLLTILICLFFIIISLHNGNAQSVNFEFTITHATSDSICDGQINLTSTGSLEPLNFIWYDEAFQLIGTSNNVSGLCTGNYSVSIDNSHCQNYFFNTDLNDSSTSGATFQLNVSLTSGANSGISSFEIQQFSGMTSPYYLEFVFNNDTLPELLYSDTVYSISNLIFDSINTYSSPEDYYYFNIWDSNIYNFINFVFNNLSDTNYCETLSGNLYASAQGLPVSDSTSCDGSAYVEVYGGTPPYSYQFSSGSTDSTASSLCPGSYIVTVTDADSNVYSTTFVIGYPGTYYFSDGGNYNYLDTLYSNAMQDCGIDYSMPIDSFYIDSAYALSNWEYVVNWTILQDTNQFAFTETYFIDSTGYYWFGLSLYCDARSSTFGSYTFFAGAMADMSGAPTQIEKSNADNLVSVYPNPSNGVYNLKASSKMESYSICDQLGRLVHSKQIRAENESINLSEMNSGMYYLIVQFQDGTLGRQKLVKK